MAPPSPLGCPQDGSQQCWGRSTLKKLLQSMSGRTGRTARFCRAPTEGFHGIPGMGKYLLGHPGWEIYGEMKKNLGKRWGTLGKYMEICRHFGNQYQTMLTFHATNPTCRGASTGGCWCGTISSSQVVIMLKCYHWSFWRLDAFFLWMLIFFIRDKNI